MSSPNIEHFFKLNSTTIDHYRNASVHTRITDIHIPAILKKLSSSTTPCKIQSSSTTSTPILFNETTSIPPFQTKCLPIHPDTTAPDGSLVRLLLETTGGSMAHFELGPGKISNAVKHQTVYEIWFFLSGTGEFWRKQNEREEIVTIHADVCITIPVGTEFQFRTTGRQNLAAVAITMPPWPGENEAIKIEGIWNPTSARSTASSNKTFYLIYLFAIIMNLVI